MLAPTMQQMDMANMGLLAQIGAQQQAQQQAQYNAQPQYAQPFNQANQQRYNNMAMATPVGPAVHRSRVLRRSGHVQHHRGSWRYGGRRGGIHLAEAGRKNMDIFGYNPIVSPIYVEPAF